MAVPMLNKILMLMFLFGCALPEVTGCGISTHIEISHRAVKYFKDNSGSKVDYAELLRNHNDALMAGSPYPDSYFDPVCADGNYHNISEDTHWAPFLKATVDYIRDKYPQPWDEATEKLVAFTFGIVSHQVADILWHSLGIDQGFLRTMADLNFHGHFDDAHTLGDPGGDVLALYEMNMTYIPLQEGWYVPTEDLYNIYANYYGSSAMMPESIIKDCSLAMFIGRLAEITGAKEFYRAVADQSPFLVDQYEKYFLGGVDDMAGWTNRIWQETSIMMEKGTADCTIPESTLHLQCNKSTRKLGAYRDPGTNGYYKSVSHEGMTRDVTVEKTLRGIRIKPSKSFLTKLQKKKDMSTLKFKSSKQQQQPNADLHKPDPSNKGLGSNSRFPDKILYVQNEYARLGDAYATGDLNFDGFADLVVTSPGYGTEGSPQEGRVYIIYGGSSGIPDNINPDLDQLEVTGQGQILKGQETIQSRFGTSVAVMDINLDGADDIAVGAPSSSDVFSSPLQYSGNVFIYFGMPKQKKVADGAANITISCQKIVYCNLGFSMTSGDVNGDGHSDLIMGSPFAAAAGTQTGFVTALFASINNFGHQTIDVGKLPWSINGDTVSGWFGYDLTFGKWNNESVLFVSQPSYNSDIGKDYGIQCLGQVQAFFGTNLTMSWNAHGFNEFSQAGWSVDIGTPYPNKSIQVIAVSAPGSYVEGKFAREYYEFEQAGRVTLYNSSAGSLPNNQTRPEDMVTIQGDREYGRFGEKVKFSDINRDGLSDFIIGHSFRTEDFTEFFFGADQGRVYIFMGGEDFPNRAACGNTLVQPCPGEQADYILQWPGLKSQVRFGSNIAVLNAASGSQIFATAHHAGDYARLAGAIGLFNFQ